MFVPTDGQRSLLECEFLLPPAKVDRLKKSWAEPFRERILPLIDEEVFRDAYDPGNGRPNTSIRLLVGLQGGEVRLESPLGWGTRVRFTLPAAGAEAGCHRRPPAKPAHDPPAPRLCHPYPNIRAEPPQ